MSKIDFLSIRNRLVFVTLVGLLLTAPFAKGDNPADLFTKADNLFKQERTPENLAAVVALLQQASDAGYAPAQNRLGFHYDNGIGVVEDRTKARELFRTAAEAGNPRAQYNYGRFVLLGVGGDRDSDQAVEFLEKAADQEVEPAKELLARSYFFGENGVRRDYAKAFPLFLDLAEKGHADAQNFVGFMYQKGHGVKLNREEAVRWLRAAADQGHAKAQAALADALRAGNGTDRDVVEAVKFYLLASKQNEITAKRPLEELIPTLDPAVIREANQRARSFRPTLNAQQAPPDGL